MISGSLDRARISARDSGAVERPRNAGKNPCWRLRPALEGEGIRCRRIESPS